MALARQSERDQSVNGRMFPRFFKGLGAHDPEKWGPVFRKDHAQTMN
jgi:hypothetical protein